MNTNLNCTLTVRMYIDGPDCVLPLFPYLTVWTRERPPVRVPCAICENRLTSANLGLDPALFPRDRRRHAGDGPVGAGLWAFNPGSHRAPRFPRHLPLYSDTLLSTMYLAYTLLSRDSGLGGRVR